jgi:hypothetical protein
VVELTVTHMMYLVCLHLKLDKQVGFSLSIEGVVFENHKVTRSPNADIPVIFLSFAFCRRQKVEYQIYFLAYIVFAQILIKIMHVYIIHIYVTRPHVHYRVITLWVFIYSCCWYEYYAEV